MTNLTTSLINELAAMKQVGMRVPAKVVKYVKDEANLAELHEYEANGMSISEIADLVIQLA